MSTLALVAILLIALVALTATAAVLFERLRKSYYVGVSVWSRWAPVTATGIYLSVLAVNLSTGGAVAGSPLSLDGCFSTVEIIALFLIGPMFLTRIGNLVATAVVAYCVQRALLGTISVGSSAALGLHLVAASATVVAALGDRMPWYSSENAPSLAGKLREILLATVTIGALAALFTGIVKVHGFSRWLTGTFGMGIPVFVVLLLLVGMFVGWLAVALGFARHFAIALLSLPTVYVMAYVTGWQAHLLVVPFALSMSLSLASGERRIQSRRRVTGFSTTVVFGR
jgi:hypothetical protein